jgi:S-formylglutathione hydrolase FrmB
MGGHGALTIALKNPTNYRYIAVKCVRTRSRLQWSPEHHRFSPTVHMW